jgi:hypothetical protein
MDFSSFFCIKEIKSGKLIMPSKAIAIRLSQKHGGVDELSKLSPIPIFTPISGMSLQILRQFREFDQIFHLQIFKS